MIRRLIVALSLVPVLCFSEESLGLRGTVSRIEGYCQDMAGDLSSIDSSLYDATSYTLQIRDACYLINGNLRFFATNFVDFATSQLQYSEDTYYAVANLESYILNIQDDISNNLVPYCQQLSIDVSTLLSHFDSLKTEFHSYAAQVLQRLASIDSNVAEILKAITNGTDGVVYDFSVLTNGFSSYSLPSLARGNAGNVPNTMYWIYGDLVRPNGFTVNTGTLNLSSRYINSASQLSLGAYLNLISRSIDTFNQIWGPQFNKSLIAQTLFQRDLTNSVGRLVVQGNTVTNCLQWSTNYFATILNPLVSEIATNTSDIAECQRVITNLLADISSRISSVTNGSDEAEATVEAEVTKAEEGLESVEKPPDPEGFEFQMFQVQGHENFISSIPEGDVLPAVLHFDFEWQEEQHHFEVDVFTYANVFALFRLAFTAMYWGVTLFVLLYLTKQVYSLVRWLVSMFGGGTSAG